MPISSRKNSKLPNLKQKREKFPKRTMLPTQKASEKQTISNPQCSVVYICVEVTLIEDTPKSRTPRARKLFASSLGIHTTAFPFNFFLFNLKKKMQCKLASQRLFLSVRGAESRGQSLDELIVAMVQARRGSCLPWKKQL